MPIALELGRLPVPPAPLVSALLSQPDLSPLPAGVGRAGLVLRPMRCQDTSLPALLSGASFPPGQHSPCSPGGQSHQCPRLLPCGTSGLALRCPLLFSDPPTPVPALQHRPQRPGEESPTVEFSFKYSSFQDFKWGLFSQHPLETCLQTPGTHFVPSLAARLGRSRS